MNINSTLSLIAAVTLGLSACGAEETTAEPVAATADSESPEQDEPVAASEADWMIALDGEGVRLVHSETGRTRLLAFGTERGVTESALATQLAPPDGRSSNEECGAGPLDFTSFGDFTANFQDDRFVGWFLRGGDTESALTTMSGVGIGTTRDEMAKSLSIEMDEDSTIGSEFHTAGFSGLLESDAPQAKVTDLWAGTNCIFR
jgi:hypothetical protein